MMLARWRRLSWWKRTVLTLAVLSVGGLAYRLYLESAAQRDLEAAVAETDRLDPHWRWSDFVAKLPRLADHVNSARIILQVDEIYLQAIQSDYAARREAAVAQGQAERVDLADAAFERHLAGLAPQEIMHPSHQQRLMEYCQKTSAAWTELEQIRNLSRGHYLLQFDKDLFGQKLPYAQPCIGLNKLCLRHALSYQAQGQQLLAWNVYKLPLQLGRSVASEPFLIPLLLRMACWTNTTNIIERVLAQSTLINENQLAECQKELQHEVDQPVLEYALRAERASAFEFLNRVATGELGTTKEEVFRIEPWQLWLYRGRHVRLSQAHHLRSMNHIMELLKDPERPRFQELETFIGEIHSILKENRIEYAFSYLFLPALDRTAHRVLETRMRLRCTIAALAAERFRLEKGRWPEVWEELVPLYLPTIPKDVYRGEPLTLKKVEDGLLIYSWGRNRTDDSGSREPFVLVDGNHRVEKDICFRLWNPTARRAITAKVEENEEE